MSGRKKRLLSDSVEANEEEQQIEAKEESPDQKPQTLPVQEEAPNSEAAGSVLEEPIKKKKPVLLKKNVHKLTVKQLRKVVHDGGLQAGRGSCELIRDALPAIKHSVWKTTVLTTVLQASMEHCRATGRKRLLMRDVGPMLLLLDRLLRLQLESKK